MRKRILKYFLMLLGVCGIVAMCKGQVVVTFNPAIHGQTLDGLALAQVMNSSGSELRGVITIRVRENGGRGIVVIQTPSMVFRAGETLINRTVYANSKFVFSNSGMGAIVNNTGRFPEGDLEYCYEVNIGESKNAALPEIFENCFNHFNQPFSPLLLVNPIDGDEICNTRPQFIWQPPTPVSPTMRFRLMVSELKQGQTAIQAISNNVPVINQADLLGNNLVYPAQLPDLVIGKKYVWQVTAYVGASIITKSEIWEFTIRCEEEKKKEEKDSYRELKEVPDGSFYIANRVLRFSCTNAYASGRLNYSIVDLAQPDVPVKQLPELQLNAGLNKYDLDLSSLNGFKEGQQYLLKVVLPNGRVGSLRFIYKDEK